MLRPKHRTIMATALLTGALSFAAPERGARPFPPVRLFYSVQWQDHSRTNSQIYAMKPDGSGQVCLTPSSDTDYRPAVSPDLKSIAFTTHRDGIRAIYLMNPDGTNQRRLTFEGDAGLCAWSPDGKQLTYSSNRNGRYCIYLMNADGTNIRRLSEGPSDDFPVWSPDRRRIAYEGRQNNVWRIYVINADGTGQKQITSEKWDNRWPQWSPDGKLIAYTSYEHGNGDIYTMRPDGSQATRQTDNPAEEREPAWAGAGLLFHSNRTGHFDIYSMELPSRAEHRLTAERRDTADVAAMMDQGAIGTNGRNTTPLPHWTTAKALVKSLGATVKIGMHSLQPPSGYRMLESKAPLGAKAYAWVGAARKDGTQPTLMLGLIVPPASEAAKYTLEQIADRLLGGVKRRRTDWQQEKTEKGIVNGLIFARIRWTGTEPTFARKMQGFIYVSIDGDTIVQLTSQDVLPQAKEALPIAEASVLTFKRQHRNSPE